jgi:hypothetical protein
VDEYAEDQRPCLVGKNAEGKYVAVSSCAPTVQDLEHLIEFIKEARSDDESKRVTFEWRPISFVRNGGLDLTGRGEQD